MEKFNRIVLKGIIKGLMAQGQKSRQLIQKTTESARDGHWQMKRRIGHETRLHLAAYAFLRGKRFREVEPYALWESTYERESFVAALLAVVNRHTSWELKANNVHVPGRGYVRQYTKEEISAWLDEPRAALPPRRPRAPYCPPATAEGSPRGLLRKVTERLTKAATA